RGPGPSTTRARADLTLRAGSDSGLPLVPLCVCFLVFDPGGASRRPHPPAPEDPPAERERLRDRRAGALGSGTPRPPLAEMLFRPEEVQGRSVARAGPPLVRVPPSDPDHDVVDVRVRALGVDPKPDRC